MPIKLFFDLDDFISYIIIFIHRLKEYTLTLFVEYTVDIDISTAVIGYG